MGLALILSSLCCFVVLLMQMQACKGCLEKERMGLLEIKASFLALGKDFNADTELGSWVNDTSSNCCIWKRVKCSNITSGHVTGLSLGELRNLYDDMDLWLNVSLFRPFEELLSLNLSYNYLQLHYDNEGILRLKKLKTLDLSLNELNSSILPNFVNFSRLELLDLSHNDISGFLDTADLQGLRNLKALNLRGNQLSGSIQVLCEMKTLVKLNIRGNQFGGELPKCLSVLTKLKVLDLSNNLFSGNFPLFTSNLTSLEYLSLFGNLMQGSFSLSTLANHSKLHILHISSQSPKAQVKTEETQWFPTFQLKSLILESCNLNMDKGSIIPNFLLYQNGLQYIDLSHNKLVGEFPSWLIQNHSRLETLLLRNNSFVGNLQLSSIRQDMHALDISNNNISASLLKDTHIFLPNIRYLNLSMNNLEGNIPVSIGELKKLWILDLSYNRFSGVLPKQVATNWIYLRHLKLSNNFLQGGIPKFSNCSYLLVLYLNNNNFNGTLDEVLANNTCLMVLDISNNSISGAIPNSIGEFSSIEILLMAENQLEGEIPSGIFNMTQLQILDLSQNRLSGSIPYGNLSSLRFLYLQRNALLGSMPFTLSKSSQLITLDLRNNKLSGNIPYWMDKLSKLKVLLLGGNNFHGHIPTQLCQLKNVTIVDISGNMIDGSIPSCFKNLSFGMSGDDDHDHDHNSFQIPSLIAFSLVNNYMNASIRFFPPISYPLMDKLLVVVEFRTKRNYYFYRGNILEKMTGLDLSCNKLTGIIPPEIGNLQQIRALNLSYNYLSGPIPNNFYNLKQIESLDLSNNNLSGEIPPQLTQLNFLSIFNVSYNNLFGTPPSTGQFATFDENNYKGNLHMCGPMLKRKCEDVAALPPSQSEGKETTVDMVAFYWSFIAAYITILLGIIMVLCINPQWRLAWFHFLDKLISRCYFLY